MMLDYAQRINAEFKKKLIKFTTLNERILFNQKSFGFFIPKLNDFRSR